MDDLQACARDCQAVGLGLGDYIFEEHGVRWNGGSKGRDRHCLIGFRFQNARTWRDPFRLLGEENLIAELTNLINGSSSHQLQPQLRDRVFYGGAFGLSDAPRRE